MICIYEGHILNEPLIAMLYSLGYELSRQYKGAHLSSVSF